LTSLIERAKNKQDISLAARSDRLPECNLCGKGSPELAFTLAAFDGPYANEEGYTRRSFFQCKECGFLCVEPFEADRYLAYYRSLNGNYHSHHDTDITRYQTIAHILGRSLIHRVLDWGCGTGKFLSMLPDSATKYGIELSAAVIPAAQERGIEILCENDLDKSAFSCSFDAVTAIDVAEHIRDLPAWKRKIAGMLKPGGYFIFLTGNLDSWAARTLGRYWYYLHYAEHISFLTETAARSWLAPEFEDVQIVQATHHRVSAVDFAKCTAKLSVAWSLEKLRMASRFRISPSFPATLDHMLVCARRRVS
jgi:2-polyprenyl-3-methyl-5-hydroxy-6-metoxy-1,4-benzoquinol methylase